MSRSIITETMRWRALETLLDDANVPRADKAGSDVTKTLAPLERVAHLIQQRDHAVTMNESTKQAHVATVKRMGELAEWKARVLGEM
jgi:hypothetical protein